MDDNSLNITYPTIAICIEDMDRLEDKEYKFTIPSLNFNMDSEKEEKDEIKNQGITNIANDKKVSIGKVEINNYFMIYVPKELMSINQTSVGVTGYIEGSGSNLSSLSYANSSVNSGNFATSIIIPPHPYSSYGIYKIAMTAIRFVSGALTNIKQSYDSIKINMHTTSKDSGMTVEPHDRIIKKGSQWIVVFIDGDPSKPAIIARYK